MTEYISKSEQKRRFKQTEEVASEISELTDKDLKIFPGSDILKKEILATRGQQGSARKRQIKYLAKVMREEPLEPIYDFLTDRKGSQLKNDKLQHEAERIRDLLISEAIISQENSRRDQQEWDMNWPSEEIPAAVRSYPSLNGNEVRKAVNSYARTRNRLFYRELFRMVKSAMEQEEIKKRLV